MANREVLIAGAGPTGLVLAMSLTRLGIRGMIVDELTAPATASRAIVSPGRAPARELRVVRGLTSPVK